LAGLDGRGTWEPSLGTVVEQVHDSAISQTTFHGEGSKFSLLECKKIKEWIIAIIRKKYTKK
jgi:hypothetical protein